MWYYNNQVVPGLIEGFESFVYLIERLNIEEDDRSPIFYIGKKNFYSRRKENGKKTTFESDWQSYYGSSDDLLLDVKRYGKSNFKRSILHFCRTQGDSGYLEIQEQMNRKVLYRDSTGFRLYYNKNINSRYHTHPLPTELSNDLSHYFDSEYTESVSTKKKWINNDKTGKILTIKACDKIVGKKGWVYGKLKSKNTNAPEINNHIKLKDVDDQYGRITMFKHGEYDHVFLSDVQEYEKNGWSTGYEHKGFIRHFVNNGIENKYFLDKQEQIDFLSVNEPYWVSGEYDVSQEKIFVINMRNNEKIGVTQEQFDNDDMLTTLNTKRIKVKQNRRIIFEGYITEFLIKYDIPKSIVLKAAKSETGMIEVQKGKNVRLNDEKYNVRFI